MGTSMNDLKLPSAVEEEYLRLHHVLVYPQHQVLGRQDLQGIRQQGHKVQHFPLLKVPASNHLHNKVLFRDHNVLPDQV